MAMRREFLLDYVDMAPTPLEKIESVEQLRILENGYKLGIVKGDFDNLGVNTPEEYAEVVRIYAQRLAGV
jgi:3-deoxy-manno-octulosonate cytidylyltransferase (CMP-KDO synthetase)